MENFKPSSTKFRTVFGNVSVKNVAYFQSSPVGNGSFGSDFVVQ